MKKKMFVEKKSPLIDAPIQFCFSGPTTKTAYGVRPTICVFPIVVCPPPSFYMSIKLIFIYVFLIKLKHNMATFG